MILKDLVDEIIVVDGGIQDKTIKKINELNEPRVKLIHFENFQVMGKQYKMCLDTCFGRYCSIDRREMQHFVQEIFKKCIEYLKDCDMVLGNQNN